MRDPAATHRIMVANRAVDTKPELALRRLLWHRGLRYRKHPQTVPGRPDIAFIGAKVAVFCDGAFWHGHDWPNLKQRLRTNREFWVAKIERNMERDREIDQRLRELGWEVVRLWDFEILEKPEDCVARIEAALAGRKRQGACQSP